MRTLALAALLASAAAQFGRRGGREPEQQAAHAGQLNDVDLAMAGWEQLSQNPHKMQEIFESFKDPDVMAKAQEMLKDPAYMEAAKAKLAAIQAKAQANGYLDANGQPIPGMASAAAAAMGQGGDGMEALAAMMGKGAAKTQEQGYADWELENAERHRAGELNDAELGMANMQRAARDPAMLKQAMDMFKDPNTMAEVKKMMQDPAFKAQAEAMVNKMKADGSFPDLSKMNQMMGGMGGAGGGAGMSELERLRAENAALRAGRGFSRDEM